MSVQPDRRRGGKWRCSRLLVFCATGTYASEREEMGASSSDTGSLIVISDGIFCGTLGRSSRIVLSYEELLVHNLGRAEKGEAHIFGGANSYVKVPG
jgi:hypothetical protein